MIRRKSLIPDEIADLLSDNLLSENKSYGGELSSYNFDSDKDIRLNVPQGQIVKQQYYIKVLKRLRERTRKKRPDLPSMDFAPRQSHAAHYALYKIILCGQTRYCARTEQLTRIRTIRLLTTS
ncbi:hypothetical protein TNCV_402361 [Trichonephila clavipes]|nr:hypothetical protein TNCV_402361 [Trichonephila clavipes]